MKCLCQSEFLSQYFKTYILYDCVYIACPVYVLSFIARHLFTVRSDNSSMQLKLFIELNRLKFTLFYFQ